MPRTFDGTEMLVISYVRQDINPGAGESRMSSDLRDEKNEVLRRFPQEILDYAPREQPKAVENVESHQT